MTDYIRLQFRRGTALLENETPVEGEPFWDPELRRVGFWNFLNSTIEWFSISNNNGGNNNSSDRPSVQINVAEYTLSDLDHNSMLCFNVTCIVTVPLDLKEDFRCEWVQSGEGEINFVAASGVLLNEPNDSFYSLKRYASGTIRYLSVDNYLLAGMLYDGTSDSMNFNYPNNSQYVGTVI